MHSYEQHYNPWIMLENMKNEWSSVEYQLVILFACYGVAKEEEFGVESD